MSAKKPPQLHELIAVEADLANTAKSLMGEANATFSKRPDHFKGQVRTTAYFDESRQQENEKDEKAMVTTVTDKLKYVLRPVSRLYDALLQKEEANQRAKSDLVVDGVTIGTDLPATFLLGMESRLKLLQQVVLAIPTLDPSLIWDLDDDAGSEIYRSDPVVSKRTEKQVRHKVLYDATDKHPAQIEKWNEDVPVAKIETTHTSGMWTPRRKADVLERLDKLLRAVKKARQRANTVDVADLHVGDNIAKYLLGA